MAPSSQAQRGSTTVEFAIVGALTMVLILSVVDLARGLYTYHLVSNAAREATRYAMVRGSGCTTSGCPATSSSVAQYVSGIQPGIDPSALTVTTTWTASPATGCTTSPYQGQGCIVTTQVSYPFAFLTPLMPAITMTMTSTSQTYVSQ